MITTFLPLFLTIFLGAYPYQVNPPEKAAVTRSHSKSFEWTISYESLPEGFQIDLNRNVVSKELISYLVNCKKIDGIYAKEFLKGFSSLSIYIDCPRGTKHTRRVEIFVSSPVDNPTFTWR